MTHEEEKALQLFETRLRQLILQHRELQKRNEVLTSELHECRARLKEAQNANDVLKRDYETLKLARMIDVSGEDEKMAKARINKLIREVDKCIALLNV